jgi:hypothetical protein
MFKHYKTYGLERLVVRGNRGKGICVRAFRLYKIVLQRLRIIGVIKIRDARYSKI